jgi:hypothetical protein
MSKIFALFQNSDNFRIRYFPLQTILDSISHKDFGSMSLFSRDSDSEDDVPAVLSVQPSTQLQHFDEFIEREKAALLIGG